MIKKAYLLVLLFISPMALNADVISLAGTWHTELGDCQLPGTTDENHLGSGEHPTNMTSQLTRLWPFEGVVNFTREIDLPRTLAGQLLEVYLERTKGTTLWIDGDSIGSQNHLHAAHVYQLQGLKAGRHEIRIRVDNRNSSVPAEIRGSHAWTDATQTNWNGILGRMEIRSLTKSRILHVDVFPDEESHTVMVSMQVLADHGRKATFRLSCAGKTAAQRMVLQEGQNTLKMRLDLGKDAQPWSEFHPVLYTLKAQLDGIGSEEVTFGLRNFGTEGTQFTINGLRTFLRGTHDGCVFPLTAYCPTDVETWMRLFKTARQYGLNHFRFHSYTPTEAAFVAADSMGIYLQVELPVWGTLNEDSQELNQFLLREADGILRQFGNHPSFMALGIGNELWGDHEMMRGWVERWRQRDNRHLYTFGSNNTLGWQGVHPGEDYMVTCRVGGGEGYSTQTRSSFSFADADQGGLLNNTHPNTRANYSTATRLCPVPIVSHETCQFQVYPDYTEIPKYTGVLYPYNLEVFRSRLEKNHLTDQIEAFHQANGQFVVECDKADIEYCLRTPGFGGYQMLDLKDYPGQGSALCGILDAFAESKGLVEPEKWCQWVSPLVPLALMDKFCWSNDETFVADLCISNFLEEPQEGSLHCTLAGRELSSDLTFSGVRVPQGGLSETVRFTCPLATIQRPGMYVLTLEFGDYLNEYHVWVYPKTEIVAIHGIEHRLDAALASLAKGETVILQPDSALIAKQSVGGLFTPDYWNYAMFKTISERNHQPVSPGTLGLLMDAQHPLFRGFPTEERSDYQWWPIARFSRPLILDAISDRYRPLIQVIDNVERNHLLGILMEFRVGEGKLLLTTTNLDHISQWPEGEAYKKALLDYSASPYFNPATSLSPEALVSLLTSAIDECNIQGVENISDYKKLE